MRIRMYNTGFGDCCCLRDKNRNLLVDFGTSNHRIGGKRRKDVFDVILSDLSTLQNKNLLLSNFELDQLSGLFYLMKHRGSSYEFGKVYLPDLFSSPEQSRTLALLLLADLLKDSWLPSRQVSLYSLAEALLRNPKKIGLLSRGVSFEKKYIALWPDKDIVALETEKILKLLQPDFDTVLQKLISFSEKIRQLIYEMTERDSEKESEKENVKSDSLRKEFRRTDGAPEGKSGHSSTMDSNSEAPVNHSTGTEVVPKRLSLTELEQGFRELRRQEDFLNLLERLEAQPDGTVQEYSSDNLKNAGSMLRDLRQKLGIVFQNQADGEWNVLFTGDIRPEILLKISENYDRKLPLFEHYWCIKVPHHGTASHFFDFSPYTPENMLISGGVYYTTGRKKALAARISPQYAGLFHDWEVTMWCSDSAWCDGCRDGCSCKECEIIAPKYYVDIR